MVKVDDSEPWHELLGHFNFTDVNNTIPRILHCAKDVCLIFALCKFTKVSVPKVTAFKRTKPLEKAFFDLLGPLNPPRVHSFRFVQMIVDKYSEITFVKFLRAKSKALEIFQKFIAQQRFPKSQRSDNGKEFTSKHFERP